MPASIIILQPTGLAAAFVVAWIAAIVIRRARQRATPDVSTRFRITVARGVMYTALAAVAGVLLTLLRGPSAHLFLGGLAVLAGAWLVIEVYRRESLSAGRRRFLVFVRLGAWTVLLVILGQPACERTIITWDKPVLGVLLDHSESMAIADPGSVLEAGTSRAALVNQLLAAAGETVDRIAELYDVRMQRIGARPEPATNWRIDPTAPLTSLSGGLRAARELRSTNGRPPPTVLLISDGAENMADAAAVRQLADDLAAQRTALWAVGVGPEPGQTPLVELDSLIVPPRIGVRDLVHVTVSGRVRGCRGHAVRIDVRWNDQVAERSAVDIDYDVEHLRREYELLPPGPGVHRLTARVMLPEVFGNQPFTVSAVVDVGVEQVRVLYLERVPHFESRFVMQAWRGDSLLDVTRYTLLEGERGFDDQALAEVIDGYDVIVLGRFGSRLPVATELVNAVSRRGVGLLISSGTELLNSASFVDTDLAKICPVQLSDRDFGLTGRPRFVPTPEGLRHPTLQRVASGDGDEEHSSPNDERANWAALPPLGGAAAFGKPKPAAVVLATDESERPLLAAHEVGRGRCLLAAWESTWSWALISDEGRRLHERLWRQMVVWLANRRPRAWVVTEEAEYALTALAVGESRVRIQAGVTGFEAAAGAGDGGEAALEATLLLRPVSDDEEEAEGVPVPLRHEGGGWTAELPDWAGEIPVPTEGRYELTFALTQPEHAEPTHVARTRFTVAAQNVERRAPTANLPLLRTAAERTAPCGGRYVDSSGLLSLLNELAQTDLRRRVLTPVRYDLAARDPWGLLLWLLVLLAIEWSLRKRWGLA